MTRKSPSKKLRFEVFKRDSFTCQYCGSKAPDVVLQCDHIEPVAGGGGADLLNLVTACVACNAGKSDRRLSDATVVEKQRDQLSQLQERRQQMQMVAEWRAELSRLDDYSLTLAEEAWSKALEHQYSANQRGRDTLLKLLKKHGLNAVFDGIEGVAHSYLIRGDDGKFTRDSVEHAFAKLGAVIVVKLKSKDKPWLQRLFYTRGILRNRLSYVDERRVMSMMEAAIISGADAEEIMHLAKTVRTWTQFSDAIAKLIDDYGERDGAH